MSFLAGGGRTRSSPISSFEKKTVVAVVCDGTVDRVPIAKVESHLKVKVK